MVPRRADSKLNLKIYLGAVVRKALIASLCYLVALILYDSRNVVEYHHCLRVSLLQRSDGTQVDSKHLHGIFREGQFVAKMLGYP